eukprot:GHVT01095177.1.p1 GENE.GHVT01095177.1~~GHVT01095177.1.p1  ORF type:complete len:107 (+),score=24.93 GHVT01095177.1:898-1218(+)
MRLCPLPCPRSLAWLHVAGGPPPLRVAGVAASRLALLPSGGPATPAETRGFAATSEAGSRRLKAVPDLLRDPKLSAKLSVKHLGKKLEAATATESGHAHPSQPAVV